jgi:hypothetical protein
MNKAKLLILIFAWVGLCASAAYFEYWLLLHLGIAFAAFTTTSGLAVWLGALWAAPKGYENESGFHIEGWSAPCPPYPSAHFTPAA